MRIYGDFDSLPKASSSSIAESVGPTYMFGGKFLSPDYACKTAYNITKEPRVMVA